MDLVLVYTSTGTSQAQPLLDKNSFQTMLNNKQLSAVTHVQRRGGLGAKQIFIDYYLKFTDRQSSDCAMCEILAERSKKSSEKAEQFQREVERLEIALAKSRAENEQTSAALQQWKAEAEKLVRSRDQLAAEMEILRRGPMESQPLELNSDDKTMETKQPPQHAPPPHAPVSTVSTQKRSRSNSVGASRRNAAATAVAPAPKPLPSVRVTLMVNAADLASGGLQRDWIDELASIMPQISRFEYKILLQVEVLVFDNKAPPLVAAPIDDALRTIAFFLIPAKVDRDPLPPGRACIEIGHIVSNCPAYDSVAVSTSDKIDSCRENRTYSSTVAWNSIMRKIAQLI